MRIALLPREDRSIWIVGLCQVYVCLKLNENACQFSKRRGQCIKPHDTAGYSN